MTDTSSPALKHMFDPARFRHIADELAAIRPGFDGTRFVALALDGLDDLALMDRLRRMTECLRATLPEDYRTALGVLRELAPRIGHGFVSMTLPDYVARYGLEDFEASMAALKDFTAYGSSEFGVRPFLKRDLLATLKVMEGWSRDESEHVRRLASEGSRSRLPWSFRIEALVKDPRPALPILQNLKADPSLYVRKSVANHLNDITKDHPGLAMDVVEGWDRGEPATAWIVGRALRTLVKKGDARALGIVGATGGDGVAVEAFGVAPAVLRLGETLVLEARLRSTVAEAERLVVDYAVHYVKRAGVGAGKVFKWKVVDLEAGGVVGLSRRQVVKDFSTRVHHEGVHRVELMVNGRVVAEGAFELRR
jgi:3-methyladenine DNA glycosylase AlkC